jgi:hypothetical protein
MRINSKRDLITWVDNCIQNAVTPEQLNEAASNISVMAHTNGFTYGDDWTPIFETLDIDDLERMAGITEVV